MTDYYDILGVSYDSSFQEIKKSFRSRAKRIHPDVEKHGSDEEIKLLLTAYAVLSDSRRRKEYDRVRIARPEEGFNYRDFLKERKEDPESLSKLIFHDLLFNQEEEALILFEELFYKKNCALEDYMDREDFMDCTFLLAEEYENHREYVKAFNLLKKITHFEFEKPYFRHFMEEVADRFKHITCTKMSKTLSTVEQMYYLREVLKLNLSKKINDKLSRKINQLYGKPGKN